MNPIDSEHFTQPVQAPAPKPANFGWFALGSLCGALLLFATSVLATNGNVLQIINPSNEVARLNQMRQAAREAMIDVISANPPPAPAANPNPVQGPAANPPAAAAAPVNVQVALRSVNIQGNANAPVTMIEFSDFQCPYCLRYHQETMPKIVDEYVKTGKVKIAFKQFPALGPASTLAAQASECAADQSAFWEYYYALYDYRAKNQRIPQNKEDLIKLATELKKYDVKTFSDCVNNAATSARVNEDHDDAQRIGGRGTPTFLVNGKIVVGAQPYAVFKAAIDEALKKTG